MMKDTLDSIQALNETIQKYHITDYLNLKGPYSSPLSFDCSSNSITATFAVAAAVAYTEDNNEEDVTTMRTDETSVLPSESVTARHSSNQRQYQRQHEPAEDEYDNSNDNDNHDVPTLEKDDIMDMEAREMLVEWCFRVTKHFHINNKIVAYALNYMDRSCSFYKGKISKDFVRLVMASSLLLSIKIHHTIRRRTSNTTSSYDESQYHHYHQDEQQSSSEQHPSNLVLTPEKTSQLLSQLTEGQYSSFVIAGFERVLIRVLGCNLLPPLPFRYLQEYLVVSQNSYSKLHQHADARQKNNSDSGRMEMNDGVADKDTKLGFKENDHQELYIQEISSKAFQLCDAAVSSYYLSVIVKPSIVGLASLCNSLTFYAVQETSHTTAVSNSRHQMFLDTRPLDLLKMVLLEDDQETSQNLLLVQDMLWQMACLDDKLEDVGRAGVNDNDHAHAHHSNNYTTFRRRRCDSASDERNKSTPHSVMDAPNDS